MKTTARTRRPPNRRSTSCAPPLGTPISVVLKEQASRPLAEAQRLFAAGQSARAGLKALDAMRFLRWYLAGWIHLRGNELPQLRTSLRTARRHLAAGTSPRPVEWRARERHLRAAADAAQDAASALLLVDADYLGSRARASRTSRPSTKRRSG
jgi:hypothetical protein